MIFTARMIAFVLVVFWVSQPTMAAELKANQMVEFTDGGQANQGLLLLSGLNQSLVLGRDGAMHTLKGKDRSNLKPLQGTFRPVTAMELRNELRAEYGRDFEVLSTRNFLIVQPHGRGNQWADLFEKSHQGFVAYMSRRGVKVRKGNFPMVAVVFPDETSMYAEFDRQGVTAKRVAGVYVSRSNRVFTHDGARRDYTRATVRHEAAHQSAYNAGVHSRLNDTPKWVTEGIGQMFEPRGMTNQRVAASVADRINQDSLGKIQKKFKNREKFTAAVESLVRDDSWFQSQGYVDDAYTISWAMMFYLGERNAKQFSGVLKYTASRPPFRNYSPTNRLRDFKKIIGSEPAEFAQKVHRWVMAL